MKGKMLLFISILFLATVMFAGGCATTKKVSKKDYRFFSGTWINEEYNTHPHKARLVIRPDGTFDVYRRTTDTKKHGIGVYRIVDKWTDSEGNIWYKMHVWPGVMVEGKPDSYELDKVSNSGNVWEYVSISGDFPTEINENHPRYHIYYRK
jgi:hypothetical protein